MACRSIAYAIVSLALSTATAESFAQTKPATPSPVSPVEMTNALRSARPGDIVMTSFAKLDGVLPPLALFITPAADGAKLVFSDRPEYFRGGDGIACQETVQPGRIRFYTYHVPIPDEGKPRRVIAKFENLGDAEATVTFNSHSEPAIGGDYNAIAKEAMTALLLNTGKGDMLKLPPHGHDISDRAAEATAKSDLLAHGLFDFVTDQPLRLTVAQVTATADLQADTAAMDTLPKLPMAYKGKTDSAGRGLFPTADLDVALADAKTFDTASGTAQVIVADGNRDGWIEGVDGLTGVKTRNKGNYGVIYHMKLKWKSTDGRGLAVLMTSARFDSQWCGTVAAAVKVNDGKHPGGVIGLPRDVVRFHGIPEACVIQTFDAPANGQEATIELDYTPPGSCCLPTPILLVPIEK
jgi:hypothetical protein